MSDYMPEQMLHKKKLEFETELKKEEQQEAKRLAYLNALKEQELSQTKRATSKVLDRARKIIEGVALNNPAFKAKIALRLQRNANIEKGKGLTKRATSYTFEIYDGISSVDDITSADYLAIHTTSPEGLLDYLSGVDFSPEMLYPSMIKHNFKDYMHIVREWERYSSMDKDGGDELPQDIETLHTIFRKNMSLFCRTNRINLDGTPMAEEDEVKKDEHLTKDEIQEFSDLSGAAAEAV